MATESAHAGIKSCHILPYYHLLGGRERKPEVQGNEDAVSLLTMQTCPNRMLAQWRLGIIEKNALYGFRTVLPRQGLRFGGDRCSMILF